MLLPWVSLCDSESLRPLVWEVLWPLVTELLVEWDSSLPSDELVPLLQEEPLSPLLLDADEFFERLSDSPWVSEWLSPVVSLRLLPWVLDSCLLSFSPSCTEHFTCADSCVDKSYTRSIMPRISSALPGLATMVRLQRLPARLLTRRSTP